MSDNPYAPNGAAAYMKRLHENKELMMPYGIEVLPLCHGGITFTNSEQYVVSMTGRIKKAAKRMLRHTRYGVKLIIEAMYKKAETAVDSYQQLSNAPEAILFNDAIVHDAFLRRFPDYAGLKVQIMHTSGDFGKMLKVSYPKIDASFIDEQEKRILNSSDMIVFVGRKNKERFAELHPELKDKLHHVHTGIDDFGLNERPEGRTKLTFLCVGTVDSRKNQRALIDVAQDETVASRVRFVVVGGGPDVESCIKYAAQKGVSDIVRFVGTSNEVINYYRKADALISVSVDEGLPTVALEAMSCGLPLLLTDVGGCEEVIEGNGVLIPSCDTESIVKGLHEFLSKLEEGEISGKASRMLYERRYTTEAMCAEYARLLSDGLA